MTTTVKEKQKVEEKQEEKERVGSEYGCDIVVEDGSFADVSTKQAPTDAYIIKYVHEDKVCFDLTRGTKIKLFDMYYDKFRGGSIQSIDYGHGTIKPNIWGYKSPQQKKRRKG